MIQTEVDAKRNHDEYPDEDHTRDFNDGPPKRGDCIVCHRREDRIDHTISHRETYWNWADMNFYTGTLCSTRCLRIFSDIERTSSDTFCLDVESRSKTFNKRSHHHYITGNPVHAPNGKSSRHPSTSACLNHITSSDRRSHTHQRTSESQGEMLPPPSQPPRCTRQNRAYPNERNHRIAHANAR